MMCGCTINKDGLWDSEKIEVKGILKRNGTFLKEVPLNWVATNWFDGNTRLQLPGNYELIVNAYDSKTGNTGVDKVNYVLY